MVSELQRIVDSLAGRVGRPALIEDHRQRVVVYSEQTEPMDEVRRLSILRRRTSAEVIAFFRRAGIMEADRPIRTPGSAELRLLPRVCVPIRHRDLLLGFVWFIDPDEAVGDDAIAAVATTTTDLVLALYREHLGAELASQRETEAVRLLLSGEPDARRHGAITLVEDGALTDRGPTTALVASPAPGNGREPGDLARVALEQTLVATRRWLAPRSAVHLVRHDHGVLLVRGERGPGRPDARAIGRRLSDALRTALRGLPYAGEAVVGVGRPCAEPWEARASYDEATMAARVAFQVPAVGPVACWSRLGIYRVLSRLTDKELRGTTVHPGLERLLDDPAFEPLLETLETYLELAGSAHETAALMNLHRTSLYYRLQRIERLAGTDLKDGNERLALHLALKLARLTGRYRPSRPTAGQDGAAGMMNAV